MASKLSTIIVTKDEESNIRRCLESIKWADEIVIVDCGSTDGTLTICEEYGCKIRCRDWDGYANQKNYALDQAAGDWILSLDADEEVPPALAEEIAGVLQSDSASAFMMPRKNLFLGRWMRHGGWYPDRQLRLFKRGFGRFKVVPLHESVELCGESMRVGHLVNPLLHFTYPNASTFVEKADRYTTIEAAAIVRERLWPKSLMLSLLLAMPRKFAEVYICKGGWRDGLHGFIAAVLLSARVFLRYVKTWEGLRDQTWAQSTRR